MFKTNLVSYKQNFSLIGLFIGLTLKRAWK